MNSYNKRARVARTVLALILAAFFVVGGTANMLASEATRADYLRWGYPAWFHYVTAALELTAAVLIAFPRTRLAGGRVPGRRRGPDHALGGGHLGRQCGIYPCNCAADRAGAGGHQSPADRFAEGVTDSLARLKTAAIRLVQRSGLQRGKFLAWLPTQAPSTIHPVVLTAMRAAVRLARMLMQESYPPRSAIGGCQRNGLVIG